MNYQRIIIIVGVVCIVMSLWIIAGKKKRAEMLTEPPSTQKAEELYALAVDLKKEGDDLKIPHRGAVIFSGGNTVYFQDIIAVF